AGSLQVTVAILANGPLNPGRFNCSGIFPVRPGLTMRSQAPAVVQPHPGFTSVISRGPVPVLVNTKSCWIGEPDMILPKSNVEPANSILGAERRPPSCIFPALLADPWICESVPA